MKLGTITPHGADVWSYAADEDALVKDPLLAEHLSHWGIDIMRLEKTEKTLGETELEKNLKYDWSLILEQVGWCGVVWIGIMHVLMKQRMLIGWPHYTTGHDIMCTHYITRHPYTPPHLNG